MSATTTSDPRVTIEPWEARFRASAILFSQIAVDAPDVGVVTSSASGAPQLDRWDTATDELSQLTHEPTGRLLGRLSPDGRWVAYLRDEAGSEIGHWVVVPVAGGDEVDMTPGLAPYSSDDFVFSRTGGRVAFMTEWYDAGHVGGDDALAIHHQRLMQDFALRIASKPR